MRLQTHNYSDSGKYFVTICTQHKKHIFGHIAYGKMYLNTHGCLVQYIWEQLDQSDSTMILNQYVIMPNHFHAIVDFTEPQNVKCNGMVEKAVLQHPQSRQHIRRTMRLSMLIGKFKMQTAKQINIRKNTPGQKLWQRNYYDSIIRNKQAHHAIIRYIRNNPKNWRYDRFHPHRQTDKNW